MQMKKMTFGMLVLSCALNIGSFEHESIAGKRRGIGNDKTRPEKLKPQPKEQPQAQQGQQAH